jgi:DNA invertase Pin-like site-specific DNA recombinase
MGRAGVVPGIEMSRLARIGKDWHQLLELCSLPGVLLADPDAVYDSGYLQRPAAARSEGDDEREFMLNSG